MKRVAGVGELENGVLGVVEEGVEGMDLGSGIRLAEVALADDNGLDKRSRLLVIGVGGMGNNTLNYIHKEGLKNVEYVAVNTDVKALSNAADGITRHQIGKKYLEGNGAGGDPSASASAVELDKEELKNLFIPLIQDDKAPVRMVFLLAGLGGGTGSGGAPVIAEILRGIPKKRSPDQNRPVDPNAEQKPTDSVPIIAVVTVPDVCADDSRYKVARDSLEKLQKNCYSVGVYRNSVMSECENKTADEEYEMIDKPIAGIVASVMEIILSNPRENIDINDIINLLKKSDEASCASLINMGQGVLADSSRADCVEAESLEQDPEDENDKGAHSLDGSTQSGDPLEGDPLKAIGWMANELDEEGDLCVDMRLAISRSIDAIVNSKALLHKGVVGARKALVHFQVGSEVRNVDKKKTFIELYLEVLSGNDKTFQVSFSGGKSDLLQPYEVRIVIIVTDYGELTPLEAYEKYVSDTFPKERKRLKDKYFKHRLLDGNSGNNAASVRGRSVITAFEEIQDRGRVPRTREVPMDVLRGGASSGKSGEERVRVAANETHVRVNAVGGVLEDSQQEQEENIFTHGVGRSTKLESADEPSWSNEVLLVEEEPAVYERSRVDTELGNGEKESSAVENLGESQEEEKGVRNNEEVLVMFKDYELGDYE